MFVLVALVGRISQATLYPAVVSVTRTKDQITGYLG